MTVGVPDGNAPLYPSLFNRNQRRLLSCTRDHRVHRVLRQNPLGIGVTFRVFLPRNLATRLVVTLRTITTVRANARH